MRTASMRIVGVAMTAVAIAMAGGTAANAQQGADPVADPAVTVVAGAVSIVREILGDVLCVIDPAALTQIGSTYSFNLPETERPQLWRCDQGSRPPTGSG